jgi:hypothetical protein
MLVAVTFPKLFLNASEGVRHAPTCNNVVPGVEYPAQVR